MGRRFEQLVPPVRGQVDMVVQMLKMPDRCTCACIYNKSPGTLYANEYPILPAEIVNVDAIEGELMLRSLAGTVEFDIAYGMLVESLGDA